MKKRNTFIVLSLFFQLIYSQDIDWYEYDLDSIIKVDLPEEEVFELDTIMKTLPIYQIYNNIENSLFVAQKTILEKKTTNKSLSSLPYDLKSLNKYYSEVAKGMTNVIPYDLSSENQIEKNGLNGYKIKFNDSLQNQVYEINIYLINRYLYSFTYRNIIDFEPNEKDYFLDSFIVNENIKINQYLGEPKSYKIGYLIGKYLIPMLFVGGIITFFIKRKKKKLLTTKAKNL